MPPRNELLRSQRFVRPNHPLSVASDEVLAADKTALTGTLTAFYAEVGPAIPVNNSRKACHLSLGISIPAGFTLSIPAKDYVGISRTCLHLLNAILYLAYSVATINWIARLPQRSNQSTTSKDN